MEIIEREEIDRSQGIFLKNQLGNEFWERFTIKILNIFKCRADSEYKGGSILLNIYLIYALTMFLNYNFKNEERKEEHMEIEWLSTAL